MDKNSIQNLYEGDASIIIHLFYSQYNLKLPIYVQPPRHKHWVERKKNITKGTVWTCENKNGLWGYESSRVLISCNSYWTQAKRMWSYTATRKSIWGNETLVKSITSVYSVSEDWRGIWADQRIAENMRAVAMKMFVLKCSFSEELSEGCNTLTWVPFGEAPLVASGV